MQFTRQKKSLESLELANQFHVDPDLPKDLVEAKKQFWKECSVRRYVTDVILFGLGWQTLSSIGGKVEFEVGVQSVNNEKNTRRFMDYFGFEQDIENPLLMVEAKRANIRLPSGPKHTGNPNAHPVNELFRSYLSLRNKPRSSKLPDAKAKIGEDWVEFLDTHVDYIQSSGSALGEIPLRSVITNGEWIVLFPTPADFLDDASVEQIEILTFGNLDSLKKFKEDLHSYLAYEELCKFPTTIAEERLLEFINPANVDDLAHGVSLKYNISCGNYRKKPNVLVAPVLFLTSKNGRVSAVLSSSPESEFHFGTGVSFNYEQFQKHSKDLLHSVLETIGQKIAVKSVTGILETCKLPPVWSTFSNSVQKDFLIVTGEQTFFMRSVEAHMACDGHSKQGCGSQWALSSELPTVEPERTMFCDGNLEFCGHRTLKLVRLGAHCSDSTVFHSENSKRCHIEPFEEYACCRSCSLLDVCENERSFSLGCQENGI